MHSGKIAVLPGGGGIVEKEKICLLNYKNSSENSNLDYALIVTTILL
jgi:hypothetical protein